MNRFAKLLIKGKIEVITGLHIGANDAYSAIGATDSPVLKDSVTRLPIISGSSLKGKMRSLLAKAKNDDPSDMSHNNDHEEIRRLFGDSDDIKVGRLIFRDCILANPDELTKQGAESFTEIKFENTIDRYKISAMPRQIERTIRGSIFNFEIVYDLTDSNELEEDFHTIADGMKLLELDYLGGHGSRGYGKVKFEDLDTELVYGQVNEETIQTLINILVSR